MGESMWGTHKGCPYTSGMSEPALLAAIAASPDDDLPRLVYADWLDENGQPLRAEFIRLQIEIAKKEALPRAVVNIFSHLWKRQQEILDNHRDDLLGPLAEVVGPHDAEFRRGILEKVSLSLVQFLHHQDYFGSLIPPPSVRVFHARDALYRLAQPYHAPHADLVTELQAYGGLGLFGEGIREMVSELTDSSFRLSRLAHLELENCRLGDENASLLFTHARFPALQDLDLSFNDLTDAGVIALLNTGVPQRLKRLVLGGNPIGDQAAIELADRLGGSTVLENLNLRMTNIGRPGQVALTRAFGGKVDLF